MVAKMDSRVRGNDGGAELGAPRPGRGTGRP